MTNNVPKLRFPEFNCEWDEKYFGDLFSIKNGLNKGKDYFGHGTPILNYMDVNQNVYNSEDNVKGCVEVTPEEIDKYGVNNNDLFLTRTSETSDEIGLTSTYQGNNSETVFSGFILRARPYKLNIIDSLFYAYYLRTSNMRNNIIKYSSITTRALINSSNLSKMKVKLPSIEEQEKIASFLLDIDQKIELLHDKKEEFIEFKHYLLQNLFPRNDELTPKLRFTEYTDEWKIYPLKSTGTIITGNTPKTNEKENYTSNGYLWITPGDINTSKYVFKSDRTLSFVGFKKSRKLPPNSVLVTCIGATIGKTCINKEECSCNQQINAIIPNKNYNFNYIYYIIIKEVNKFKLLAGNTATPILNKNDFSNLKFKFPKIEEQCKIASFLSVVDKKIDLLDQEIEYVEEYKKGLLQKMFIWRVVLCLNVVSYSDFLKLLFVINYIKITN